MVDFLYELDGGVQNGLNFANFGTKKADQLDADELQTLLGAKTGSERNDAGEALAEVLGSDLTVDRYCLQDKFKVLNMDVF